MDNQHLVLLWQHPSLRRLLNLFLIELLTLRKSVEYLFQNFGLHLLKTPPLSPMAAQALLPLALTSQHLLLRCLPLDCRRVFLL